MIRILLRDLNESSSEDSSSKINVFQAILNDFMLEVVSGVLADHRISAVQPSHVNEVLRDVTLKL